MNTTVNSPRSHGRYANVEAERKMNEILADEQASPDELRAGLREVDGLLGERWSFWEDDAYTTLIYRLRDQGRLEPDVHRSFLASREEERQLRREHADRVGRYTERRLRESGLQGMGLVVGSVLLGGTLVAVAAPLLGLAVGVGGVIGSVGWTGRRVQRLEQRANQLIGRFGVNAFEAELSKLDFDPAPRRGGA